MLGGMAEQIRVQVYEGLYRSQSEDFFEVDATEAARHGWFPTRQAWTGSRLTVSYAYRKRARPPRAIQSAGNRRQRLPIWLRVVYWAVVIGTVLAALVLLIAVLMSLGIDRKLF
jgi:hypothetical protein